MGTSFAKVTSNVSPVFEYVISELDFTVALKKRVGWVSKKNISLFSYESTKYALPLFI